MLLVVVGKGWRMLPPWHMLRGVVPWLAWRGVALTCYFDISVTWIA